MASRMYLFLFSAIFLYKFCHAFVIPVEADCHNEVPESYTQLQQQQKTPEQYWTMRIFKNLAKYRNFYANLLQEENKDFAVEIQELYSLVCKALTETDMNKKHKMLFYSMWLVENTKDLEDYLIAQGIRNI